MAPPSRQGNGRVSPRVVEDDSEGKALAALDAANHTAQRRAAAPARSLNRPLADREDYTVALADDGAIKVLMQALYSPVR